MSSMTVTAVMVSLKVGDMDYGRGSERFVSLRGEVPEGEEGIPIDNYDDILTKVLDIQLEAWEAVQGSRYVGGVVKAPLFKELIATARKRTKQMKQFLIERGEVDATDIESTES